MKHKMWCIGYTVLRLQEETIFSLDVSMQNLNYNISILLP